MSANTSTIELLSPNRIPTHICAVVKDADKTSRFLSSIWGLGPWQTLDYATHKDDMIVGEPFKIHIVFAELGATVLELIQPVEGRSVWARLLETNGEGMHHIAFTVSNWEEIVSKLKGEGGMMLVCARYEGKRWCYIDTKPGGIIVELAEA